jgi:hypothetical protein
MCPLSSTGGFKAGVKLKKHQNGLTNGLKTGTGQMGQRFQPHILGLWAVRLEAGALLKVMPSYLQSSSSPAPDDPCEAPRRGLDLLFE